MKANRSDFATGIRKGKKFLFSEKYHHLFDVRSGISLRWGKTQNDDPPCSPFGPEIADVEISTVCNGSCSYCYKSNTAEGKNMPLATFKKIIGNINCNRQLTQVAFGLGATAEENPELWDMCAYLRDNDIVPNGTVANVSGETARKIARWFGACAVSMHLDSFGKNVCYDNVQRLTDCGIQQVNIHYVLCEETYNALFDVFNDIKTDARLGALNAIVLLSLKQKGRACGGDFHQLSQHKFSTLVNFALDNKIDIGFDSCSACKFRVAIQGRRDETQLLVFTEGCEASLFSLYANVEGRYFPCSFAEGIDTGYLGAWREGIDLTNTDFIDGVWNNKLTQQFREDLLKKQSCLLYTI
jgi:hypothetical protein